MINKKVYYITKLLIIFTIFMQYSIVNANDRFESDIKESISILKNQIKDKKIDFVLPELISITLFENIYNNKIKFTTQQIKEYNELIQKYSLIISNKIVSDIKLGSFKSLENYYDFLLGYYASQTRKITSHLVISKNIKEFIINYNSDLLQHYMIKNIIKFSYNLDRDWNSGYQTGHQIGSAIGAAAGAMAGGLQGASAGATVGGVAGGLIGGAISAAGGITLPEPSQQGQEPGTHWEAIYK